MFALIMEKGEEWKINKGSRQGGILSPVLFNFYIKGRIVNHDVGCKIRRTKWNVLAYAYNFVLIASSLKKLQKLIVILGESI